MWHKILGHCNVATVKKLQGVVQGMVISDNSKSDREICVLAKQVNARNKQLDVRATCSFELVRTDLVGPIDPVNKDIF